jgi:hypothetical protein
MNCLKIGYLSVNLSVYQWLHSPLLGLGRFFSSLIFYSVGRTPWTGDQPVARPLPAHRTAQTQNKHTIQTSMPRVGFKPTTAVLEREKRVHALHGAATVNGKIGYQNKLFSSNSACFGYIISIALRLYLDVQPRSTSLFAAGTAKYILVTALKTDPLTLHCPIIHQPTTTIIMTLKKLFLTLSSILKLFRINTNRELLYIKMKTIK